MNNILLIIILIIIIVSILIYNNLNPNPNPNPNPNTIKIYDTFEDTYYKNPQDIIANDGKMKFNFLKDPYYSQKIINEFYLNDDKKINGVKVNYHPYINPVPNCPISADFIPYVYSANPSLHCRRRPEKWHKFDTRANDIYNQYSIYR
jgi:hypothetical protein